MKVFMPRGLRWGDTVGVVAPASPAEPDSIMKSLSYLEEMGYKVKLGKSVEGRLGYLAGNDKLRADDINRMFTDNEVSGIICLRGGYGSVRILDEIDFPAIKRNPKIFIGYSDITALHIAIHQNTGLITFHGPMLASDMNNGLDAKSKYYFNAMVKANGSEQEIINPQEEPILALVQGKAKGRITGGNLAVICSMLGTPYEIDTKGKILFLEDIGEEPYRIDRMLMQLKLSKKLEAAVGIVLCSWTDCEAKNLDKSLTLAQIFEDIVVPCQKPTLLGYCIGHCTPNITVPIGAKAIMDADKKSFIIAFQKPEKPYIDFLSCFKDQ